MLFYLDGFAGRQLATFTNTLSRLEFIDFMEQNNGVRDNHWYKFIREKDFHNTIVRARELGGVVYDLPVKSGI